MIKGKFVCTSQVEVPNSTNNTTPSATPSTTSAPGNNNSDSGTSNSGSGLSGGAKAGIGVGIACFVLIVIGALRFLRKRKTKKAAGGPEGSQDGVEQNAELPSEKGAHELKTEETVQELSGTNKDHAHELQASHGESELPQLAPLPPQELPASPVRERA